jgi:Domain of unknown function (DUF4926)
MIEIYSRVRLLTDRFYSEGVALGDIGYVIETYPGGNYEVEFSRSDGTTIALVVAREDELVLEPELR